MTAEGDRSARRGRERRSGADGRGSGVRRRESEPEVRRESTQKSVDGGARREEVRRSRDPTGA